MSDRETAPAASEEPAPAYWLMVCRHRAGVDERRAAVRDAHRAHVASGHGGRVRVLVGSALTDDAAGAIGNFGVLEAPDRAAAEAFAETDPYALAGLVESIEIIALPPTFPAHRIDPMTPAPRRSATSTGGGTAGRSHP